MFWFSYYVQPVMPKTKLMSRSIGDFFKGKKTPPILHHDRVEIRGRGGYLFTGIALTNKESQVREQDDAYQPIKYYTFTSD